MAPARPRLLIGDTDMPPGFVAQTVLSSTASRLVLHAPPGVILWTLDGDSCRVDQTWLVIPDGGSPGGGGFGGRGLPLGAAPVDRCPRQPGRQRGGLLCDRREGSASR